MKAFWKFGEENASSCLSCQISSLRIEIYNTDRMTCKYNDSSRTEIFDTDRTTHKDNDNKDWTEIFGADRTKSKYNGSECNFMTWCKKFDLEIRLSKLFNHRKL